jgi:glyoxylase-like metal-dependent hydrolase (beta-lactamase superfamily II)
MSHQANIGKSPIGANPSRATCLPAPRLRRLGTIASLLAALLGSPFALPTAQAAAPQVKAQAPGFYRMMIGDIEVTALLDGVVDLQPKQILTDTSVKSVDRLLKRSYQADSVPNSVNTYLINTGNQLILVDTGAANFFGPTLGKLLVNLKAAGYSPEQVDHVLITHMHIDHIGGLTVEGKPVFPNATLRANKLEADYWLNIANRAGASKANQGFFEGAVAQVGPYAQRGKLAAFDKVTEIVPGITALPAAGHTPGHTFFAVESKGQKLVLWGDVMHFAAVQFPEPKATVIWDTDTHAAAGQRKRAYAEAARDGYLVAAAHLPFPGIGRLRAEKGGFVFVPIVYQSPN